MNYKMIGKFISQILMAETIMMFPALLIAFWDGNGTDASAFVLSMVITFIVAAGMYYVCRDSKMRFYAREGLVCVGLSWVAMSLLGCLPFWISGEIPHFIDALFEMVSGFTTTGSSILTDVEAMSRACLYWRSFSHWVGGMGVLVLLLAIDPVRGNSHGSGYTLHLLRAESPGPTVGKLVPKMRQTAQILYIMYLVLTVLDFGFLLLGQMDVFEALCTAFGTAGTGGFGLKADSIGGYSPYIQNVTAIFMLLFGVNFSCYYLLIMRHFKALVKDEELRAYLVLIFGSIALIAYNLRNYYDTVEEMIRYALFQVATLLTSTGFATADFDQWPNFSKGILLTVMLIGACAGSTGGGFKVSRMLLLLKNLRRSVRRLLNPQRVEVIRMNGNVVPEQVIESTSTYLAACVAIVASSFLILCIDGKSMMTNLSAVIACFNNMGPGFEDVGPACNFSEFSIISKLVLILDMLAGRLEIYPMLVLFSRTTWRGTSVSMIRQNNRSMRAKLHRFMKKLK